MELVDWLRGTEWRLSVFHITALTDDTCTQTVICIAVGNWARSRSHDKRLLDSLCPSVRFPQVSA